MSFSSGYALVIGIGRYAEDAGLDVPATADDARAIWSVLTDPASCGYPPGQVTLLTDTAATRQGILEALEQLSTASLDATVTIFYSGHGVMLPNDVFALSTHDMRRVGDGSFDAQTVVTAPELVTRLRGIRARKLLCLLNACHSGAAVPETLAVTAETLGASVPANLASALLATGKGRVIMTACQADEVAYVGDSELTLFPSALVAALEGDGISDRRGFIGVYDLYDRVYELVTAERPDQQPELTVSQGVGPFPVALFQGSEAPALAAFEAPAAPRHSSAVRALTATQSRRMLQEVLAALPPGQVHHQVIGGNARVDVAIVGNVEGGVQTRRNSDDITVGDITGSSGIAIGRGARSNVHTTGAAARFRARPADVRSELRRLLAQFEQHLAQAPASIGSDAGLAREEARDLVARCGQAAPDARAIEYRAAALFRLAEGIDAGLPGTAQLAQSIITTARFLIG